MTAAERSSSAVRDRLTEHFGLDPLGLPVISVAYDDWLAPVVQCGLNALLQDADGEIQTLGVSTPDAGSRIFGPAAPSLAELLVIEAARFVAPEYTERASGPDQTMLCMTRGLILMTGSSGPVAVWLRPGGGSIIDRRFAVEVLATDDAAAGNWFAELEVANAKHTPLRGKVLAFSVDDHDNIDVAFPPRPQVSREELVLPEPTVAAIERHTVEMTARSQEMLARGRHLRRGVMLHGPPGGGKTLVVRYLASAMPESTVLMMSGTNLAWLPFACEIARDLAPAILVLEDLDLIAEDRTLEGMSPRRHMFDLLDAMDGLGDDVDIVFLATTNRPESIERAIAARPGRVDQAISIDLPDADCRRRLLDLYARGMDLEDVDLDAVIARTAGTTASLIRELLRKAAVLAVLGTPDASGVTVTGVDLDAALTGMGL